MANDLQPFQFDMSPLLNKARRVVAGRLGEVTLNLPFVSIAVSPKDREREVARELILRLRDRRVLSSQECCDHCIDASLASLQEIRQLLVDKQVALSDLQDGPVFLLTDMMREGIRQFLTFEERLSAATDDERTGLPSDFRRRPEIRDAYFTTLDMLRGHLSRCIGELAVVAGIDPPSDGLADLYQTAWDETAYVISLLPPPDQDQS